MSEQAAAVAEPPVVEQPTPETSGLPAMSDGLREAFASAKPAGEAPAQSAAPAQEAEQTKPAEQAAPPAKPEAQASAPAYGDLLKELGVDSVDALKEKWTAAKDFDPKAYEAAKANQRDDHDKAVRALLEDPSKARAYFDLQAIKPEELAAGSPDQQRALLFEKYKIDNPQYSAARAEVEFEEAFETKYALADSEDTDDPAVRRAKLRYDDDLAAAAPAVKQAQEAGRVALLPKANEPTAEQLAAQKADDAAWDNAWVTGIEALEKGAVEQKFQSEFGDITAAFDMKTPDAKEFLTDPITWFEKHVIGLTNNPDYKTGKPFDLAALAQLYGRITQSDAIAKAAGAVGKASVGAHVRMDDLNNPAPSPSPEGMGSADPDRASVLAKMRAATTGR